MLITIDLCAECGPEPHKVVHDDLRSERDHPRGRPRQRLGPAFAAHQTVHHRMRRQPRSVRERRSEYRTTPQLPLFSVVCVRACCPPLLFRLHTCQNVAIGFELGSDVLRDLAHIPVFNLAAASFFRTPRRHPSNILTICTGETPKTLNTIRNNLRLTRQQLACRQASVRC